MLACGLLGACAGPSYRVVQPGAGGYYLVAQTPSEIRHLRYDSGFYSPFHFYGIHPWWNYTYYSPNFYPHYFSVRYPSWPDYASGYGGWDRHRSGVWPPRQLPPIAHPSPPSGVVELPGSGGIPGDSGIGSGAQTRPREQRTGGRGRYREMGYRGVRAKDTTPGPAVSPPTGTAALRSPVSPAWSQTGTISRPSPAPRVRTGKPASRSYRSIEGPPRQHRH